jgi:uncharacterized protein YdeI (YjbR/CyaY-like superfamily)
MGKKDPRVDAYIAEAAEFARPVLKHLRALVHSVCPDVEETLKWRMPFYEYKGILFGTPAFKQHCALVFWKGRLIVDQQGRNISVGMGQFKRVTKLADLPSKKILTGYILKAMELNELGTKSAAPSKAKAKGKKVVVSDDLAAALKKNSKARATFEGFTPGKRRDYVEWITEAKREETRQSRLKTAIEWLAQGKPRNWKYIKR